MRAWHAAYRGIVPDAVLQEVTLARKKVDWERSLSKNSNGAVVATIEDKVVGWATFGPSRDSERDVATGELYAMYVDPDRWRTRIGKTLWAACELELSKRFLATTLWVIEANERARKFYERVGFVLEPEMVLKPQWLGVNQVRYRIRWPETVDDSR